MAKRVTVAEPEDEVVDSIRRARPAPAEDYDIDMMAVATPTDRIRWGPILAGVATAISSLVILNVLGLAIGLTAFDAADPVGDFGLGAGVWGAISAIIAFVLGGLVTGYTAAIPSKGDGALNGALVWLVTIPLMLFMLSSGIGTLLSVAGNVAQAGADVAAPLVGEADITADVEDPAVTEPALTEQQIEETADTAASAAWGTLLALLVGLGAAALGGYWGARDDEDRLHRVHTT